MRRPSFDSLALAIGLFAGTVVFVGVVTATGVHFLAPTPLVTGIITLLVVAGIATTRTNLVSWIVDHRIHTTLALGMSVITAVVGILVSFGIVPSETGNRLLLVILAPLIAAFLVYITTIRRYEAYLRDHERVLAEWTAAPDTRYKRIVRGLSLVGAAVFFVGGVLIVLELDTEASFIGPLAGVLLGRAAVIGRYRRYTLYGNGLVIRVSGSVSGLFVPRDQLRSVSRSERALTIRRGLPWPLPIRCSTADLDDPSELEATLRERIE